MTFDRWPPCGVVPRVKLSVLFLCSLVLASASASCSDAAAPRPPVTVDVATITIPTPASTGVFTLERGTHLTITAVARNSSGTVVTIPFVWRSSNERVLTVDGAGRLSALDTGSVTVAASALGVISNTIGVRVIWVGPTKIETFQFNPPGAISPGALPDSIHALVSDHLGGPVANARIAFAVTAGGGTVSPAIALSNAKGIASAAWKLGSAPGANVVTATVLGENDVVSAIAVPNIAAFTLTTFAAVSTVDGDAQTGLILSRLPVNPSVKVVDPAGRPRLGVPVSFAPSAGGRVTTTVVATGADGVASPGAWTLGDNPGEQTLIASVELASQTLHATATGIAVHYMPASVTAGTFASCAISLERLVSCWGEEPKIGDSSTVNKIAPTRTASPVPFQSLAASPTSPGRFCGVALDQSILCWGFSALSDSVGGGMTTVVPTAIVATRPFTQVAPGLVHTCALSTDQNVYCWGDNSAGQLGDRLSKSRQAPAPVYGGFRFSAVTSGSGHSCGVSVDGGAFCWGLNQDGQLGNGTTQGSSSPVAAGGGLVYKQISAGQSFTCGLTTLGRAYCWGNFGTGSTPILIPRPYPGAPDFTAIVAGAFHSCALTADGTAYCWGDNSVGQLGDNTLVERTTPTAVLTAIKFRSISAGVGHTCGNSTDGSVACWGLNKAGELGDSIATVPNRLIPRFMVLGVKP